MWRVVATLQFVFVVSRRQRMIRLAKRWTRLG